MYFNSLVLSSKSETIDIKILIDLKEKVKGISLVALMCGRVLQVFLKIIHNKTRCVTIRDLYLSHRNGSKPRTSMLL